MAAGSEATAGLSVAIALSAGIAATLIARHLSVPGIVLLLGAGVLLGPEVAGLVQPSSLGSALHTVVGFAVAVILFEGGMSLDVGRLRREARVIQLLILGGAAVTTIGGAAGALLFLGWEPRLAILFGTLVIVTGPTVVTPLLRRINVNRNVQTILEAEGVFGDAVGALVAVMTLEVILADSGCRKRSPPRPLLSRGCAAKVSARLDDRFAGGEALEGFGAEPGARGGVVLEPGIPPGSRLLQDPVVVPRAATV